MPNTMTSPAALRPSRCPRLPPRSNAVWIASVADSTDSPSTIRVNRPYRSAMCPGCHVVPAARSAQIGTSSSATTSTRKLTFPQETGTKTRAIHPHCTIAMPAAKRRHVRRRSGSEYAARNQCATIASRITTYPMTTMLKLPCAKARGMPAARISAPVMSTSVVSR